MTIQINHDRCFGVEIELSGLDITSAATALRNAGFQTYDSTSRGFDPQQDRAEPTYPYHSDNCQCSACCEDWRLNRRPARPEPTADAIKAAWRVIPDGSVENGCEVVSPILSGNSGLDSVRGVVKALKAAGAVVNVSCGFHVHVDARDLQGPEILNAVSRYARYESEIDAFMAPRRRGNRSEWCQSMMVVATQMLARSNTATIRGLVSSVGGRYYKLNVAAYLQHGTLEFRQHAGTLNINKMAHWIVFAVNFVEDSRLPSDFIADHDSVTAARDLMRLGMYLANNSGRELYLYRAARAIGVAEETLPELFTSLKEQFPAYAIVTLDERNNLFVVGQNTAEWPTARQTLGVTDWGSVPTPPPLPVSAGVFDNLPRATAAYLSARRDGYATSRQTASGVRAIA